MGKLIIAAIFCLVFFVLGGILLLWPRKVQRYYLSYYENDRLLIKWNPFLNWMKKPSYLVSLRIIGVIAIAAGTLVLFAVYKHLTS